MTTDLDTRRAQLRTDVTLAARVVPTHYPLETFIAVNPLAGLEGLPFEQAIRRAGDLYGMPGTLGEQAFRELHRNGRINDADLDRALRSRYPNMTGEQDLRIGGRSIAQLELLRADMLHGLGGQKPLRRFTTRAEDESPTVAETVDLQTSKWCAAYFGGAAWPMPGRESGFYPAWRALAPGDRSLARSVRKQLRRIPERADDAVLEGLSRLGIDDERRVVYFQAHLTRMPGWAAHVQWCAGQGAGANAGIDVLGYLAMRITYESLLMDPGQVQHLSL
ncbi:MAG: DUF2309 domain-containing protein, partial [Mycobacterium sp.]|nr:DUF2309 domain-containing protein [Mycobacterium sp.]